MQIQEIATSAYDALIQAHIFASQLGDKLHLPHFDGGPADQEKNYDNAMLFCGGFPLFVVACIGLLHLLDNRDPSEMTNSCRPSDTIPGAIE